MSAGVRASSSRRILALVSAFAASVFIISGVTPAVADDRALEVAPVEVLREELPGGGELDSAQASRLLLPSEPFPDVKPVQPEGDFGDLLDGGDPPVLPPAGEPEEKFAVEPIDIAKLDQLTGDLPVEARDEFSTTYDRGDGSFLFARV